MDVKCNQIYNMSIILLTIFLNALRKSLKHNGIYYEGNFFKTKARVIQNYWDMLRTHILHTKE